MIIITVVIITRNPILSYNSKLSLYQEWASNIRRKKHAQQHSYIEK